MSFLNALQDAYLSYFSSPRAERVFYRTIKTQRVGSILEIGIRSLGRVERMLAAASRHAAGGEISYTGIDLFEGREHPVEGLTLKAVHRRLSSQKAKIRLVPGDPFSGLSRSANSLAGTDLIVINEPPESLARAWIYFPRMLHERTQVFALEQRQVEGEVAYRPLPPATIQQRATVRRAA